MRSEMRMEKGMRRKGMSRGKKEGSFSSLMSTLMVLGWRDRGKERGDS